MKEVKSSVIPEISYKKDSEECIFNPMVIAEEKKLLQIMDDSDHRALLHKVFSAVKDQISNQGLPQYDHDKEEVCGMSILKTWNHYVKMGMLTWREFHSCVSSFGWLTVAKQFTVLYQKDRMVTEVNSLQFIFESKGKIFEKLVDNGVITVAERSKILETNYLDQMVKSFVLTMIGKNHKHLARFYRVLWEEKLPEYILERFVLLPEKLECVNERSVDNLVDDILIKVKSMLD